MTTARILQIVWFSGSALLGLWLFGTWLTFTIRLHKDQKFLGKRGRTNIYVSKRIKSPCLAGLIPAVYLTEDVLRNDTTELIVRHELTHLRHLDFLWSFCRTLAVIVYWWNPLIWLAAIYLEARRRACVRRSRCGRVCSPSSASPTHGRYLRRRRAKKAALSLAGPPVKERILFLTKRQRTSAICIVLALAQDELKTATPLTQRTDRRGQRGLCRLMKVDRRYARTFRGLRLLPSTHGRCKRAESEQLPLLTSESAVDMIFQRKNWPN